MFHSYSKICIQTSFLLQQLPFLSQILLAQGYPSRSYRIHPIQDQLNLAYGSIWRSRGLKPNPSPGLPWTQMRRMRQDGQLIGREKAICDLQLQELPSGQLQAANDTMTRSVKQMVPSSQSLVSPIRR